MSDTQYQSLAAPIIVAGAAETITLDKWFQRQDLILRRPSSVAARTATCVEFGVEVDVPAGAWQGSAPDILSAPRCLLTAQQRAVFFDPNPIPNPAFSDTRWAPTYPSKLYAVRYKETGGAVAPLHVPDVTQPVTALSWKAVYPDTIARKVLKTAQQTFWHSDKFTAPVAVVVPDHSWHSVYPDKVWSPKGLLTSQQPFWTSDKFSAPTDVPFHSWHSTYPDRIDIAKRITNQQQAFATDPTTPVITTVPDLSIPTYPSWLPTKKRITFAPSQTAPLYVPDVTQLITPGWNAIMPAWIARKRFSTSCQLAFVIDPTALTLPSPGRNFTIVAQTYLSNGSSTHDLSDASGWHWLSGPDA